MNSITIKEKKNGKKFPSIDNTFPTSPFKRKKKYKVEHLTVTLTHVYLCINISRQVFSVYIDFI